MQTLNRNNYGATMAEAELHLRTYEPFHTGTFSAMWETIDGDEWYVVRSYGTAIAVVSVGLFGRVFESAYTHSKTTSKHANLVKKAWAL